MAFLVAGNLWLREGSDEDAFEMRDPYLSEPRGTLDIKQPMWIDSPPKGLFGLRMFTGLEWALPKGSSNNWESHHSQDNSTSMRDRSWWIHILALLSPGKQFWVAFHPVPLWIPSGVELQVPKEISCLLLYLVWATFPPRVTSSPPSPLLPGITSQINRLHLIP